MAFDLKGRAALVTGAGRGIGRAVATKLAECGASVMINDIDRDVLFEAGEAIGKTGGTVKAMPGDVTNPAFPEKLVNATVQGFGSIDIIVNNAGYTWDNVIPEDHRRTVPGDARHSHRDAVPHSARLRRRGFARPRRKRSRGASG
jgi:NAD(P)-dependent dehydrogenase (short-subunit alcohol dehydrogenase family)